MAKPEQEDVKMGQQCDIDNKEFESHETHENIKEHKCEICQKCFSKRKNLNYHLLHVHKQRKRRKSMLKCDNCEQDFQLIPGKKLQRHVLAFHESQHECKHNFATDVKLRILSVRKSEKPHECYFCQMRFVRECHLKAHIQSVHQETRPHKCDCCDASFYQKSQLNAHIQSEHLKPKHQCLICEKFFASKSYLSKHIKSVHERRKSVTEVFLAEEKQVKLELNCEDVVEDPLSSKSSDILDGESIEVKNEPDDLEIKHEPLDV